MHIHKKKNYSRSLLTKINLHDEGEINFLNKNIDKDSIFIDCGANQDFIQFLLQRVI